MAFTFKTGDIFYSPRKPNCFYIVTNDNTNLGGYGPGSIEFCYFPNMDWMDGVRFYKLPRHLNENGYIKVT